MKKILSSLLFVNVLLNAHPVSYTIDLEVSYDEVTKKAKIVCSSNSRNKCGLHSFHLLDDKDNILVTKRFPFLKKETFVVSKKKPKKMIFFLRKTPDHKYTTFFN